MTKIFYLSGRLIQSRDRHKSRRIRCYLTPFFLTNIRQRESYTFEFSLPENFLKSLPKTRWAEVHPALHPSLPLSCVAHTPSLSLKLAGDHDGDLSPSSRAGSGPTLTPRAGRTRPGWARTRAACRWSQPRNVPSQSQASARRSLPEDVYGGAATDWSRNPAFGGQTTAIPRDSARCRPETDRPSPPCGLSFALGFPKMALPPSPPQGGQSSRQCRPNFVNSRRVDAVSWRSRLLPPPSPWISPPPVSGPDPPQPDWVPDLRLPKLRRRTPRSHVSLQRSPRSEVLARSRLTQPLRPGFAARPAPPLPPARAAIGWAVSGQGLRAWVGYSGRVMRLCSNLSQGRPSQPPRNPVRRAGGPWAVLRRGPAPSWGPTSTDYLQSLCSAGLTKRCLQGAPAEFSV